MENQHKGSEFRNIIETWEQNERDRENGKNTDPEGALETSATTGSNLEQIIKQEAAEYENENKENRILGGDRATINDDEPIQGGKE